MTCNRRWFACGLVGALTCSPPIAAAAPSSLAAVSAEHLFEAASAARDLQQFAIAAEKFEEAHDALPDTCSPLGLKLLEEADSAYREAYARDADAQLLCRDERMLVSALGDGSCELNSAAIGDLQRGLDHQLLRDKITCPTATQVSRDFDESLPAALVTLPPSSPSPLPRLVVPPASPRRGATIAGAVLLGAGAAATIAATAGAVRGGRLNEIKDGMACETDFTDSCRSLNQQGRTMNNLAIASGVVAGALVVTGVALLIVGQRRSPRRASAGAVGALPGLTWRF